ncbi:DUF805 domain-containing protein [Leptospira ognonensis]|uniref:DUF805 domain-containing protein n=1 Tax=Leptospira ognonensis TaxID=2484945 RepID=A0A4V3JRQ8_9LEPT|nr:DUF805 domain-containing protein [Leptospira ognonensis]TGL61295.1 DUF805 domain-containing protein [Leptospira ognonensis]
MQFQDAIKVCFQKYVDFNGTAKRPEFWYFFLFVFVVSMVLNQVHQVAGGVFSLAILLPSLAVGARRLHDTGKSGWWQLIALTGIGYFVLLFFWSQEGK